jgi:hypothetical protein
MENILHEASWEEQGTVAYIIADTHVDGVVPIEVLLLQQGDIATELVPLMKKATSKEEAAWWMTLATTATKCIRKSRAEFEEEELQSETRKRRMAAEYAEARGRQEGGPQYPIDLGSQAGDEPSPKRARFQPGTEDPRGPESTQGSIRREETARNEQVTEDAAAQFQRAADPEDTRSSR